MTHSASPNAVPKYQVFARAFSSKHDKRRAVAHCSSYQEALTLAANRVLGDLGTLRRPGQSAKALFETWKTLADDFFIIPDDAPTPFSSTDLARLLTPRLTGDYSHPLLIQVTCNDCLLFASGGFSAPQEWTFWVKAPATYTGATHLLRRAADELYREMSISALQSEGSRYVLLELNARELTDDEAQNTLPNLADKTVYFIQNDGSFAKTSP